jgi:glycosyltransferase involved in cell wall biosynthesis
MDDSKPLVSIITPTHGRAEFLAHSRRWVQGQTYPNIEWLILDDSPEPSPQFAAEADPRIRYAHLERRLTIGEKRNRLIAASRGEYVAHFDDDDYYAPHFLELMIASLEAERADFANLSSWFLFDLRHDLFGFWDLRRVTGLHYLCHADTLKLAHFTADNNATLKNNHLAYGFTYVYRRRFWETNPFPAVNWGEDAHFVGAARPMHRLLSLADQMGLVLHLMHSGSTSACFPQYRLPPFLLASLFAPYAPIIERLRRNQPPIAAVPSPPSP